MATTLPFTLRDTSLAPDAGMTDAEKSLAEFTDLDLWFQPGANTQLSPPPRLILANRIGAETLVAAGSDLTVTTDFSPARSVISSPGGNLASQEPMHVPNYVLGGSYVVAVLVRFDPGADMSAVQHLWSAGIPSTDSRLQVYNSAGSLFVKHGTNNNTQASMFVAGQEYLVLVTYDADAVEAKAYVNSLTPVAWGGGENVAAAAGGDQEITFGGRWDAAKDSADQTFEGSIRAMWAGRAPWGRTEYDAVRGTFMQRVADLYADITLA